jgi:putative ABC transport system substrate-binding protein
MRRREFIGLLSGAAIAWPSFAKAQGEANVAVLLGPSSIAAARFLSGLPQGLQELGYVEGRNIDTVHRFANGDLDVQRHLRGLKPKRLKTAG